MGPAQAHETGPYGAGHLVLQARDQCGPCQEHRPACQGRAPCRRLITPSAALTAALGLLAGLGAERVAAGLDLPAGVEPLAGAMDAFGQRYRPLRPAPLTAQEGLALALREAGRALLRPAYDPGPETLGHELAREHQAPAAAERPALEEMAKAATALAQAALAGDALAARRLAGRAPGLTPLAGLVGLVGAQAPPRLDRACRLAAGALEAASSL
jgi:hypothetical protein